jgi:large subunit ribosomal protein L25
MPSTGADPKQPKRITPIAAPSRPNAMSKTRTLHAEPRKRTGSGSLKQMRREGWLPCVVYGRGVENHNVKINARNFATLLKESASDNILVNLQIGDEATILAFLQALQHDPLTGSVLHVDFRAVDENTEINAHLPVELVGESVGVHAGGVLEQILHTLEIRCLPKDLPEMLTGDISGLDIGDFLHVGDVPLPDGVEAVPAADIVVAQVVKTRTAEEDEEEGEALEEGEEAAEPAVVGKEDKEEE